VYKSLADQPDVAATLDRDLAALARRFQRGHESTTLDWEYLLLTATKKRETVPSPR
jgi:hypothetical protein